MNSEKVIIILAIVAFVFFAVVIAYNFIDWNSDGRVINVAQQHCPICLEPPDCPVPEVIEYPYPVEVVKTVTSTVEVIDEQCQKDFAEYKTKYQSAVYSWCLKHKCL